MYYLFILAEKITSFFSRDVCYSIAKILALLRFYLSRKDREAVIYNLTPVVEDKSKLNKYAKEVFINFAYYLVDFFRYSKINKKFIDKYVKVEGLENLDKCLTSGKGVITLSVHLGNYELGGAITSLLGYSLFVVALQHKDERLNEFFNYQRDLVGVKVIPAGVAVKRCFRELKKGGVIAFLGDRDFSGAGLKVKMFGRYAVVPRGPAFFVLKTDSYIVPSFLVRENKKYYRLIFENPIGIDKDNLNTEEGIINQYIPLLEKYIKNYPQQWYLFVKYWL